MLWIALAVAVGSFFVSVLTTAWIRHVAHGLQMVDVPNLRSSHSTPTPRGGGIAIAVVVLPCLLAMAIVLPDQRHSAIALCGGGLSVALIGMLDDRYGLSIRIRLLTQIAAAIWVVVWLGGYDRFQFGPHELWLSWVGPVVAVFYIVWCTNLYNFMDGIDGVAGSQAVIAGAVATIILWQNGDSFLATTMLATSSAGAGFLIWNWPPAKIFLGDCGSGLLGFLFGCLVLAGHCHGSLPPAAGFVLILVFFADASLTLGRRILFREAWYRPHRSHAYQLAVQLGASHKQVTSVASLLFLLSALLAWLTTVNVAVSLWGCVVFGCGLLVTWLVINLLYAHRMGFGAKVRTTRAVGRSANIHVGAPVVHVGARAASLARTQAPRATRA